MKIAIRKRSFVLAVFILLVATMLFGPRPSYPSFDARVTASSLSLEALPAHVETLNAGISRLKPDNEARIVWASDSLAPTPYSLVYLHGFSASPMEGAPIHQEFARRYGMNLYLPLLAGHGRDDKDSFRDLTPKDLIESAKEALAIGKLLGEHVIVMATSTGCTLATYLAAENPGLVDALIFYAPNIDLYSKLSNVLTLPWGLNIGQMVEGKYRSWPASEAIKRYWTTTYRLEGVVCLRHLIDQTMTPEVFQKIEQPLFVGYYYKNEEAHDKVISIEAIERFYAQVRTPEGQKQLHTFPNVDTHVAPSAVQSKDVEDVRTRTFRFADEVLRLPRKGIKTAPSTE